MTSEHVLLVEGINDLHAVRHLAYKHGIPVCYEDDKRGPDPEDSRFEIKRTDVGSESGGQNKFPRAIKVHLNSETIRTLGIVADADEDPAASWEARLNDLFVFEEGRSFTSLEEYETQEGWIGEVENQIGDPVRAGVWIMPNNDAEGALEEFAMELVPEGDDLWDFSETVIEELPERRFDDKDEGKALIHTWLAWQETPREPIGRAINQGVLEAEKPLACRFVDWVRRLFPELGA